MEKNKVNTHLQSHQSSNQNDVGLRRALQQINNEAQQTALSDDFEKRLMNSVMIQDTFVHKKSHRLRIAAIFLALVAMTGLAYSVFWFSSSRQHKESIVLQDKVENRIHVSSTVPLFRFENTRLDSVLAVVAENYHYVLVFTDEQPRRLRISTTWQPQQPLSAFVNVMNELDGFRLAVRKDTIFVIQKPMRED